MKLDDDSRTSKRCLLSPCAENYVRLAQHHGRKKQVYTIERKTPAPAKTRERAESQRVRGHLHTHHKEEPELGSTSPHVQSRPIPRRCTGATRLKDERAPQEAQHGPSPGAETGMVGRFCVSRGSTQTCKLSPTERPCPASK